jgi:hypothetical protein
LDQLESTSCLGALKSLKHLFLHVCQGHLASEQNLFSSLSRETIEEISIGSDGRTYTHWKSWLAPLQECPNLKRLSCVMNTSFGLEFGLPLYLKCLPQSLIRLEIQPFAKCKSLECQSENDIAFLSSPEFVDCFHHLPRNLIDLNLGHYQNLVRLSDGCFTHLPPTLTRLNLAKISGITDLFWQLIPPHISVLQVDSPSESFKNLHHAYNQKLQELLR